jgi:hypothetical protein
MMEDISIGSIFSGPVRFERLTNKIKTQAGDRSSHKIFISELHLETPANF